MFSLLSRLDLRKLCAYMFHCDAFEEAGSDSCTTSPINRTLTDNSDNVAFSYLFHSDGNQMTRAQFLHSAQMPPSCDTVPTPMETDHIAAAFISTEKSLNRLSRATRPPVPGAITDDALLLNSSALPHDHNTKEFDTYSILHRMVVIAMFVFLLPTPCASGCPNPQFKMVASHHDIFDLRLIFKPLDPPTLGKNRYYIAFGRKDKWSLTLVDPKTSDDKFIKFKCKENQFGAVEVIEETKLTKESEAPICCAASYLLDKKIDVPPPAASEEAPAGSGAAPPAANDRFPILPEDFSLGAFKDAGYRDPANTAEARLPWPRDIKTKYYYCHYISPTCIGPSIHRDVVNRDTAFVKWRILKMDPDDHKYWSEWTPKILAEQKHVESASKIVRTMVDAALFVSSIPVKLVNYGRADMKPERRIYSAGDIEFKIPAETDTESCGSAAACETGIVNDVVAFMIECKERGEYDYWDQLTSIQLGFSGDGIFNVGTMARCGVKSAKFFPVLDLYKEDPQKPKYSYLVPKWELASFCASCPATSVSIKVSEKEANTNKRRVSRTISVSGSVSIGDPSVPVKGGAKVGYAQQWAKEAARSLVSGQATTIKADCNGFALWHWKLTVGTWGAGRVVVPTHLFYCTDRDERPKCIPHQVGYVFKVKDPNRLCNGHDVDDDFESKPKRKPLPKEWQSMHSGRPKPIRLQGQKTGEPGFSVVTKAASRVLPKISPARTLAALAAAKAAHREKKKKAAVPVTASGGGSVAGSETKSGQETVMTGAHLSFGDQYGGVGGVSAHLPFGDQSGNHLLLRRIHRKRK